MKLLEWPFRVLGVVLKAVCYLALALGALWSILALWYFTPLPLFLRRSLAVLWSGVIVLMFLGVPLPKVHQWRRLPTRIAVLTTILGIVAVISVWPLKQPSSDRDYRLGQERVPIPIYAGDGTIRIQNFRNAVYRTLDDFDVLWETRTYPLNEICGLELMLEPFLSITRGVSHFMISFVFRDGERVCVSVEARAEADETFALHKSPFKEYELIYVVGDERDLVYRRIGLQGHSVYIYPITSKPPEELRALFVLVMNHAASMDPRPLHYHPLHPNCTTSIMKHIEYLQATDFPWRDPRIILPGFIDKWMIERGMIDCKGSIAEVREQAHRDRSALEGLPQNVQEVSSKAFSAHIRHGRGNLE